MNDRFTLFRQSCRISQQGRDKIKARLLAAYEDAGDEDDDSADLDRRFSNVTPTTPESMKAPGQFCIHLPIKKRQMLSALDAIVDALLSYQQTPIVYVTFKPKKLITNLKLPTYFCLYFSKQAEMQQTTDLVTALESLAQQLNANKVDYWPKKISTSEKKPLNIGAEDFCARFFYSKLSTELAVDDFLANYVLDQRPLVANVT